MEGVVVKLSKHTRYLVRVRDYETVQVECGAEISHYDLGYGDEEWAGLTIERRHELIEGLHRQLIYEVDQIAREELEVIAGWSEINPNLAEDYLSEKPPTTMQRKPDAKTTSTTATSSRNIRRGTTKTTPLRPA
jgi:hypothetical protein